MERKKDRKKTKKHHYCAWQKQAISGNRAMYVMACTDVQNLKLGCVVDRLVVVVVVDNLSYYFAGAPMKAY